MVSLVFFRRIRRMLRKNLIRLVLLAACVIAYGTISEYLLERNASGSGVKSLFDSLWFVMQTITTVGYGDTPVVTFWGRTNALVLMVFGIGIIGFFSAGFASVLIDYSLGARAGEHRVRLRKHILICNWNSIAGELMAELRNQGRDIVVLAQLDKRPDEEVEFVNGTCLHTSDLKKASADQAGSVIVLSESVVDGELASAIDAKTILGTMNARKLNEDAHIVVELLKSDSIENVRLAGADEVVVRGQVSAKLLSRAAVDPGVVEVMQTLLTFRSGEEIFEDEIPPFFKGKNYEQMASAYLRSGAIILALKDTHGLKVNPPFNEMVQDGSLIYVARERVSPKL
ncbi:MAG: NAD-binding protein [Nitrososphaerota archaeon]|nr:NAD-binding protein [Nitrososphaerota archaeon]